MSENEWPFCIELREKVGCETEEDPNSNNIFIWKKFLVVVHLVIISTNLF